jgi:hypothetical protein
MFLLRRFVSMATIFCVALVFTSVGLHAQLSTRGTITGTVTDPTGAVVQGAKVTITDEATKVTAVDPDKWQRWLHNAWPDRVVLLRHHCQDGVQDLHGDRH